MQVASEDIGGKGTYWMKTKHHIVRPPRARHGLPTLMSHLGYNADRIQQWKTIASAV